ncbi:DinB family protein [Spirosoma gilvum]
MTNQEVSNELDSKFSELLQLLSPLSEDELNRVPFEESWTAAQLGDHLSKAYNIMGILTATTAPPDRPFDEKLAGLQALFLNYSIKMKSAPEITPDSGPFEKAELIGRLTTQTQLLVSYAEHNDLTLLCLNGAIPQVGTLTRYEWLLFLAVHTQRHIRQLKNIIQHV